MVRSINTRALRAHAMFRPLIVAALLALGAAARQPAAAQQIKINPLSLSAILNGGEPQPRPQLVENSLSSTGYAISPIRAISWAEFPFSVSTAGVYTLKVEYSTASFQPAIVVDIRRVGTEQHIATGDLTLPATAGGAFSDRAITGFNAPLPTGDYVLRVQNVSGAHFTAAQGHGVSQKDVAIGSVTLTRSAAMPATGAISGVINSDMGFPVQGAMVLAVAPGTEISEPGPFWYRNFWTVTDAQGAYSLPVPAGSYVVQAGRPDSYEIAGAKTGTLTVSAAGLTAPPLTLTARRDFEGAVTVEAEYYHRKNPDSFTDNATGIALMGLVGAGGANNGYTLGYIEPGDWVEVHADVEATGWYTLTSLYFNGCDVPGVMRFTTDAGSSTQGAQPPTSWTAQGGITFARPIYLNRGHNIIRQTSITGCSNMDAFVLTPGASAPGDVLRLEAEEFTRAGGGSAASPAGGSSGIVIDSATGPETGKDGQTVSGAVVGFWSSFGQGSFDIGWQTWEAPEYLEYTLDVGQDGLYSMNVRAAFVGLARPVVLRVWNLSYGVVVDESFDITDENSGGYGAPSMNQFGPLPELIPLKAGPNRLRIYLFGGLNADWFEFTRTGPLDGAGVVTGQVTSGGQPVANAQVSSVASLIFSAGSVDLGTRAVSNEQGRYSLLLPLGTQTIRADALGLASSDEAVTVSVSPTTRNLSLAVSNLYEAEWFTNAWQSIPASGHGLSALDNPDASQGQTIGYFDVNTGSVNEKEFVEYRVLAPTEGIYNVTIRYLTDSQTPAGGVSLLIQSPATGSSLAVTVPKSDVLTDFVAPLGVPLPAGTPTLRFVNNSTVKGSVNMDYFTLSATGQGLARISGTVTAAATEAFLGGASVVITSGETVVASVTTSGTGAYSASLAPGAYSVTVSAPGYETQTKSVTLVEGANPALDFSMVGGRLRGVVRDADGQPLAETAVLITSEEGLITTVVTDASGAFDTVASLGPNAVLADVPLSVTEPFLVDVTVDSQVNLTVHPLTDGDPLPLAHDQDFFTTNDEQASAQRDTYHTVSGWYALPAEESPGFGADSYPATVTLSGLPFLAADPTGTARNVRSLVAPNNVIQMPAGTGHYRAAVLVLATDGGEVRGVATVRYTDGSSQALPFYAPEWFAGWTSRRLGPKIGFSFAQNAEYPIQGATELFRFTHRHVFDLVNGDGDGRGSYEFRFYSHVLPLDPNRQVESITLPEDVSGLGASPNPFVWAVTMAGRTTAPARLSATALKIAGGLEAAPGAGPAFNALNADNTGASKDVIDLQDAIALARQGQ